MEFLVRKAAPPFLKNGGNSHSLIEGKACSSIKIKFFVNSGQPASTGVPVPML